MRNALIAFALLAACGGSSSKNPDLATGPTTTPTDLAAKQPDFSGIDLAGADFTSGSNSCADVLECALACTTQACVNTCYGQGTPSAQNDFEAIFTCAKEQCGGAPDGGADFDGGYGSCTSSSDTSDTCEACIKSQAKVSPCLSYVTTCLTAT